MGAKYLWVLGFLYVPFSVGLDRGFSVCKVRTPRAVACLVFACDLLLYVFPYMVSSLLVKVCFEGSCPLLFHLAQSVFNGIEVWCHFRIQIFNIFPRLL